jgi:pimeloyl-ACP methyl ester carboxylesterase
VPLDWSGATPGTISLAVEELPAAGVPKGVMFMVAGGPGQASAQAFDLAQNGGLYRSWFPGYTLVAFDPRGTGDSGFLACNPGTLLEGDPGPVKACADLIGPSRVFYTTAANAADLDAVRQAVGADKVALFGVSYGTKVLLAYAQAYPAHVERLLLDSVLAIANPDPLRLDELQNMPAALSSLCSFDATCRTMEPKLAADLPAIANRAAVKPLEGGVNTGLGVRVPVSADGALVVGIAVTADLDAGVRAELPSAVAAARKGRPTQLLRLIDYVQGGFAAPTGIAGGTLVATTCNDGRFPWQPTAAIPDRQKTLDAAIAALPPGATGPFGTWAAHTASASFCLDWPAPAGNAPLAGGGFPDVPVLALSGSLDMRTPTAEAASVVAQFPHGHLLVDPNIGHSVMGLSHSGCVQNAVRLWLDGGVAPATCPAERPLLADVGPVPPTLAAAPAVRGVPGVRGRTLSVVETTVRDALAGWFSVGSLGTFPGLVDGYLGGAGDLKLHLSHFSDVPGVVLDGTLTVSIRPSGRGPVDSTFGTVTVSGGKAAHGRVRIGVDGSVHATWTR